MRREARRGEARHLWCRWRDILKSSSHGKEIDHEQGDTPDRLGPHPHVWRAAQQATFLVFWFRFSFGFRQTSPCKVYLAMYKKFCPRTQAYVFGLLRASRDLCMKSGDSIQSYIDKATDIASKLQSMGVDLGRVQLVLQIIYGLTDDYCQIRSSLNCLRDLKDMSMEWLTVSLLQEEAFNKKSAKSTPL